ncbi:hypothetical protein [Bradyrhizobium sp. CCBAU 51765]|jgi:hypothetical protein|nr:hypothetical protein [Bradyrhizobium sp. CCBAU 51765]
MGLFFIFCFDRPAAESMSAAGAGYDDFDLDAVPVNVIDGRNLW